MQVSFKNREILVCLSSTRIASWARSGETGIYGEVPGSDGPIKILVEKDLPERKHLDRGKHRSGPES